MAIAKCRSYALERRGGRVFTSFVITVLAAVAVKSLNTSNLQGVSNCVSEVSVPRKRFFNHLEITIHARTSKSMNG
jgi:hypothetical protein